MNKKLDKKEQQRVIEFIAIFFICFINYTKIWLTSLFGTLTWSQVFYHLAASTLDDPIGLYDGGLKYTLLYPLLTTIGILGVFYGSAYLIDKLLPKVKLIRPSSAVKNIALVGAAIISCIFMTQRWDGTVVEPQIGTGVIYEDIYDKFYKDPKEATFTYPESKRNLIYISMDNIEATFFDKEHGGAFDKNIIPELYDLAQTGAIFTEDKSLLGFEPTPGTTWSAGAMTGQMMGIPLTLLSNPTDATELLPGAYGIGDVLNNAGYTQTALFGFDSGSEGRKLLYTSHGFDKVIDYISLKEDGIIPSDYKANIGIEDQKLFEIAKDELTKLASSGQPFHFTTLTSDTYHLQSYTCDECKDEFDSKYLNAVACTSRQVASFVSWIQEQPFYENTTVIIAGNNLSQNKEVNSLFDENTNRKVFFTILNGEGEDTPMRHNREFTTFDIYPTTLSSLGIKWDGDQLGFGINLYSSSKTLQEICTKSDFHTYLKEDYQYYYTNIENVLE